MSLIKTVVRETVSRFGYTILPSNEVRRNREFPADFDAATVDLCRAVGPFTMTSPERISALRQGVLHILKHSVPGDVVECGVWKGGSMMAVARTLLECGDANRNLHLFDTFEGMSSPTEADVNYRGETAPDLLAQSQDSGGWIRACGALEEVKRNMSATGYPPHRIAYVKGKVEETIPQHAPDRIALLRLDTDWYESTRHELEHLYPRLSQNGILIIDDYGHWTGARKAVDEYLEEQGTPLLLCRIDYTGRIAVKPQA